MFAAPKATFFLSVQTYMELFTYACLTSSVLATNFSTQSDLATFTVLGAFFTFPLYLEKVQLFGLHVLALKKTLYNSLKFMPLLGLLLAGFILAFNLRLSSGVSYFKTPDENGENPNAAVFYTVLRAVTLVLGDFDTTEMGSVESLINSGIYLAFIGLMCVVVLNLLVGVAVADIGVVLDEADTRQIALRIVFVLQVEQAWEKIRGRLAFVDAVFNMRFEEARGAERGLLWLGRLKRWWAGCRERPVDLEDPQKRLETKLNEMARSENAEFKLIEKVFRREMSLLEGGFVEVSRRLEDQLNELGVKQAEALRKVAEEWERKGLEGEAVCGALRAEVGMLRKAVYVSEAAVVRVVKEHFDEAYQAIKSELVVIRTRVEA